MTISDQDLDAAKTQFVADTNAIHALVNGDDQTVVDLPEGGQLDTFAKLQKSLLQDYAHVEQQANKDATGGYAGLTGFKLNLQNLTGSIKSLLSNSATAIRNWTLPDKDGTIALTSDLPTRATLTIDQVDNTSDVNKPISTLTAAALAARELLTNKAVDFSTVDDTKFPSVQAVKTYVDNATTGLLNDRGNWSAAGGTYPNANGSGAAGAIRKGDTYYINVAGTLGSATVNVGDSVRAMSNAPGQTAANWNILEGNVGYVPENNANKDSTGGYAGLTAFKLNVLNAAGNVKSFFTTIATVARTYTLPDKDGTIAMLSDITATGSNTGDETTATIKTKLGITTLSGSNTGDQTLASLAAEGTANKDATGGYVGLTAFKLNMKNVAGTITSWLTNTNTAARTYTFPDKDGTVAMTSDITGGVSTNAANTFTATQTFNGTATTFGATILNASEKCEIIAAAVNAASTVYMGNGHVHHWTAAATANFTFNIGFTNGNPFNNAMAIGDMFTVTMLVTQGATPYQCQGLQIDGVGQTVQWANKTAPAVGTASSSDTFTFTVLKTAASTYKVWGTQQMYG
jgi:hypothetical protein